MGTVTIFHFGTGVSYFSRQIWDSRFLNWGLILEKLPKFPQLEIFGY